MICGSNPRNGKGIFLVSKMQTQLLMQLLLGPFYQGPAAWLRLTGHSIYCLGVGIIGAILPHRYMLS